MSLMKAERLSVFLCGAAGYGLCELLWRGYTHISMLILGGICFLGLYESEKRFSSLPLLVRCVSGGVFITSLELVTGCVANVVLGLNVWDYSDMPMNFCGQICISFFFAWVMLCVPALFLCRLIADFYKKIYL